MKFLSFFLTFLTLPLLAQNYASYSTYPVARMSFLRSQFNNNKNSYQDATLVGYWPLSEITPQVYDYSGNNNIGTWIGTKTGTNGYFSSGKIGPFAGIFDGTSDYVTISSTLGITGNQTLLCWMNTAGTTGSYGVFLKVGDVYSGLGIGMGANSLASTGNNLVGVIENVSWLSSSQSLGSTWALVTLTFTGGTAQFYFNGQSVATSGSGSLITPATGTFLGGYPSTTRFAKASISGVRVYNRVLSQSEIQAIYAAEKPCPSFLYVSGC